MIQYTQYPAIEWTRIAAEDHDLAAKPCSVACTSCKHEVRFMHTVERANFIVSAGWNFEGTRCPMYPECSPFPRTGPVGPRTNDIEHREPAQ